jgi:cytochrome c oxidase assembly protein subunit 11
MRLTRNDAVLAGCLAVVVGMVGASYAAVPLYYMFCRATGYGGTPNRADAAPGATGDRVMHRSLRHQLDPALPWSFAPDPFGQVKIGGIASFFPRCEQKRCPRRRPCARSTSRPIMPALFHQDQCFCFTGQAGSRPANPWTCLRFFVAPAILSDRADDNLTEITLSYTFYPATNQKTGGKTASVPAKGPRG